MKLPERWWNDYVGIPYVSEGRTRSGCDCAGLVCLVYRELLGKNIDEDFGFYDPMDKAESCELLDRASVNWKQVKKPKDFDVVRCIIYGEPCHVGIIVDGGKALLNVRSGVRTVIEPLDGVPWKDRIHSIWRLAK